MKLPLPGFYPLKRQLHFLQRILPYACRQNIPGIFLCFKAYRKSAGGREPKVLFGLESVSASAAAKQKKDDPQAAVISAAVAESAGSIAVVSTAAQHKDNPQAGRIVGKKTGISIFTAASTVCST